MSVPGTQLVPSSAHTACSAVAFLRLVAFPAGRATSGCPPIVLVGFFTEVRDLVVGLGLEETDPICRHVVGVFVVLHRLRLVPGDQLLSPGFLLLELQVPCQRTALCMPVVFPSLFIQGFDFQRVPEDVILGALPNRIHRCLHWCRVLGAWGRAILRRGHLAYLPVGTRIRGA
jgi:hypothetical protein